MVVEPPAGPEPDRRTLAGPESPAETPSAGLQLAATLEPTLGIDGDGTILDADAAALALLGIATAELVGRPLAGLLVPDDGAALARLLEDTRDGADALRLEVRVRADGERSLATELIVAPRAPDAAEPARRAVFVHDISGRRVSERLTAAAQAVVGAMTRAENPGRAMESLLGSLGASMDWDLAGHWSLTVDGTFERVAAWAADDGPGVERLPPRFLLAGSFAGRAVAAGAATWATDLGADPDLPTAQVARSAGLRGAIAIPLRQGDEVTGVMEFFAHAPRAPDPAILRALQETGAQVGELLGILEERHQLLSSLARLALTDELTGLPNRRAWQEAIARELARAHRSGHPVCVAVLDLDRFKRFNDEHGHLAGDRMLADAARAWQGQLRMSDVLARYGGEEFAALIPAWPLQTAVEIIERVRAATPGAITASAGIAAWDGAESADELFGRADAALYAAKQAGRDRTVVASA